MFKLLFCVRGLSVVFLLCLLFLFYFYVVNVDESEFENSLVIVVIECIWYQVIYDGVYCFIFYLGGDVFVNIGVCSDVIICSYC